MATLEVKAPAHEVHQTVFVDTFTERPARPGSEMLGPVADGGHIVATRRPAAGGR